MGDRCELSEADGHQASCDSEHCIYWRALSHLGTPVEEGCAIDHYRLIGDEARVKWLLSVKARLERPNDT